MKAGAAGARPYPQQQTGDSSMKKAALIAGLAAAAAAAMAAATAAQAQTQVQIYGIMDAAIVGEHGGNASPSTKITSGAASASRIGFRGTEDLGNGLSAFFTLETGTKIDTGEVDAAGTIFNRQAFVGLKSQGRLGGAGPPVHAVAPGAGRRFDPFGTGYAGGSKNLFPDLTAPTSAPATRSCINRPWCTASTATLAYSFGEQGGSFKAGRQFGGAVGYATARWSCAAYNSKNTDVGGTAGVTPVSRSLGRNKLLAANYQFPDLEAARRLRHRQGLQQRHAGQRQQPLRRREADPVDGRPRGAAGPRRRRSVRAP
jgi:hypothetical protein